MEGLWADDAPRTAVKSLQTHLSRLRKALADAGGDELQIETRPSGYLLRIADGATDVNVVEAMVAAARSLAARGALAAAAITVSAFAVSPADARTKKEVQALKRRQRE